MAVYRVTKFTSNDMSGAAEASEGIRSLIESANSEFIDIVDMGDGNGLVIAKYADEAATDTARSAFGQMVQDGHINGDSIEPASGTVVNSF